MNRGWSLLAVCALFLSGVAIGALGMHLYYASRLARPGAPPAMAARHFGERLERALELSPDQRDEIREILAESRLRGAELRSRLRPEVEALMEATGKKIDRVLTPEQREKLDEMRRFDRRWIEQLQLGPAPRPRHPGDRRRGWRDRRFAEPSAAPEPRDDEVPSAEPSEPRPPGA